MNILQLGYGKTGSMVAEVARARGHKVRVMDIVENPDGTGLTKSVLQGIDVAIDFTTPDAVLNNITMCARHRKSMVVGTTGWYGKLENVRAVVENAGIGFVYGANYSLGVNIFFLAAAAAARALREGYSGKIEEWHHITKKDAPSGTAVMLQDIVMRNGGQRLEITSYREGDATGTHTVELESEFDSLALTHTARSRRGFAIGAVRAAEWLKGKTGFYDFRDIFQEV